MKPPYCRKAETALTGAFIWRSSDPWPLKGSLGCSAGLRGALPPDRFPHGLEKSIIRVGGDGRGPMKFTFAIVGLACALTSAPAGAQTWGQSADFCRQPNTVAFLLSGLHRTAGMEGAAIEGISTTYASPDGNTFSCHVTVVSSTGARTPGTITSSQDASGQLHANWINDASPTPPAVPSQASGVGDRRCNAPPYGGTVAGYKAFIKDIGPLLDNPAKMLAGICNVKFGHANRTAMYNLGFTDEEIRTKDTADLAVEMVQALKNLVDKRPDK